MTSTQILNRFQQHGIRHTRRREAVYRALCATRSHPTAEELRVMVLRDDCTLSLATIYSTLDLVCRQGLVRRMSMQGRADRFDSTTANHLHLRLEDTGEVVDVPDDVSRRILESVDPAILRGLEKDMGVEVDEIEFSLVGRRRTEPVGLAT